MERGDASHPNWSVDVANEEEINRGVSEIINPSGNNLR